MEIIEIRRHEKQERVRPQCLIPTKVVSTSPNVESDGDFH